MAGLNNKDRALMLNAINFWMGVECLSPNNAPDVGQDKQNSAVVTWKIESDADWPWRNIIKKCWLDETRKRFEQHHNRNKAWSFVVYCGLAEMKSVVQEIRTHLGAQAKDEVGNYRAGKPPAALVLTLNENGIVTGEPFISSMPWAMGQLLNAEAGTSLNFSGFFSPQRLASNEKAPFPDGFLPSMTKEILEMMGPPRNIYLGAADEDNPPRPVTLQDIKEICDFLFDKGGWSPKKTLHLRLRTRLSNAEQSSGIDSDDDAMLNSFYVDDLELVSQSILKGEIGQALTSFMSGDTSLTKIDLRDPAERTIFTGTLPKETPLGCWPSDHSLVLAQQFAVNAIMKKMLAGPGIFSVNGPPGTGKTTLLRDVVASVIVDRATIMAAYDDPLQAYHKMEIEGRQYPTYRLDSKLTGNGIVVASANNGAVENITKELPGIKAVPKTCSLRYFSGLSDSMLAAKDAKSRKTGATWGLIAAVLGRKENKDLFFQRLCWPKPNETDAPVSVQGDELVSLWTLMKAAQGTKPWADARSAFAAALERSRTARSRMQQIVDAIDKRTQNQVALKGNRTELKTQLAEIPMLRADLDRKAADESRDKILFDDATVRHKESLTNCQRIAEAREQFVEALSNLARIEADLEKFTNRGIVSASDLSKLKLDSPRYVAEAEASCTACNQSVARADKLLDSFRDNKPSGFERFTWSIFRLIKPEFRSKWELEFGAAQESYTLKIEEHHQKMKDLEYAKEIATVLDQKKQSELRLARVRDEWQVTDTASIDGIYCRAEEERDKCMQPLRESEGRYRVSKGRLNEAEALLTSAQRTIDQLQSDRKSISKILTQIRKELRGFGVSTKMKNDWLNRKKSEEDVQLGSPWFDAEFFSARKELFIAAMELQESFIINSWKKLSLTLNALYSLVNGKISHDSVKDGVMELWEALFLVVPVISTTFASISRMFQGCLKESLGWLLIDEAGQATPQQALGAIWRSKHVVVVGDPLQLEPIISLPEQALEPLRKRCDAEQHYTLIESSAQVLADKANDYGTYLGSGEKRRWVGSPLRVHRRCLKTMFDIANKIAYDGMMVYGTKEEEGDYDEAKWFGCSCWIDIAAVNPNGHSIPAQDNQAVKMVAEFNEKYGLKDDDKFNLYVISPFKDVNNSIRAKLFLSDEEKKGLHGTIHIFQGKEADVVIIVLGGDPGKPGVISGFAAAKANLLNVAVTRAKKRIYVIGDRSQWIGHKYFEEMANLPVKRHPRGASS